jgi:hypothetical protein
MNLPASRHADARELWRDVAASGEFVETQAKDLQLIEEVLRFLS